MNQLIVNIIRNNIPLGFMLLVVCSASYGQTTLSYLDFLNQVKTSHPLTQKANLLKQQADLVERQSRGAYDPVLTSKMKEKYFQNKFYYNVFDTDISINTITGIKLSAGFGDNDGLYLNPENYTPKGGTGYLGASVPIGKGLFMDENRLALRSAQQLKIQINAESNNQLNDLLYSATESYWDWFASCQIAINTEYSVGLAQARFNMVKTEQQYGELSPLDTLKAFLQLKEREIELIEAKRAELSSYFSLRRWIWDPALMNVTELIPDGKSLAQIKILGGQWSVDNHPKLVQLDAKIQEQRINKRYKIESLKPKLNLDYKLLYNQVTPNFSGLGNNQLWGLSFQYPLFLRAERAGLKLASIKIESLELDTKNARNELETKLQNEVGQLELVQTENIQLKIMVENYSKLLEFENVKFLMGESTLFELNSWETKLLGGQNKVEKTQAKIAQTYGKLFWYSNSWSSLIP